MKNIRFDFKRNQLNSISHETAITNGFREKWNKYERSNRNARWWSFIGPRLLLSRRCSHAISRFTSSSSFCSFLAEPSPSPFPSSFSQSWLDGSRVSSSQRADKEFKRFREFAPRTLRLIDFFSFPTLTLLVLTGFALLRPDQKTYPPSLPPLSLSSVNPAIYLRDSIIDYSSLNFQSFNFYRFDEEKEEEFINYSLFINNYNKYMIVLHADRRMIINFI